MIPPHEAAALIVEKGVPVVYIDTCSILDLIRGQRDAFNGDQASAAVHLISLAEVDKLTLAFPQQVMTEFRGNIVDIRKNGQRSIDDINTKLTQIFATMQAYGLIVPQVTQISGIGYVAAADSVINRLMAVSLVTEATPEANNKAMQRVIDGRAPAASAKQSAKDCLVLESVIETLTAARAASFAAPAFFLSANVAEYGDETKRVLHADLSPEFGALNMSFAKSYLELRYNPAIAAL